MRYLSHSRLLLLYGIGCYKTCFPIYLSQSIFSKYFSTCRLITGISKP